MMRRITSIGSLSIGIATNASAMIGRPPIAYTSEIALVAAMRPKSYGSSTIGMKKSVVAINACWSFSRYTAASSAVSMPTSNSFGNTPPALRKISDSTPGAILQPQPPPCENEVRRSFKSLGAFMAMPRKTNDAVRGCAAAIALHAGLSRKRPDAPGGGRSERAASEPQHGVALFVRCKARRTPAGCLHQPRIKRLVARRALQQARTRGNIADWKITRVVVAQQTHVAVDAAGDDRRATPDRLDHGLRAALHQRWMQQYVRAADRPTRRTV